MDFQAILGGGPPLITQLAVKQMLAQSSGGCVTCITSAMVEHPIAGVNASLAMVTKGGLEAITRSLAMEYVKAGIRFNAVAPGVVETPLTAPIKNNEAWYQAYAEKGILNRWAQPSEMAGAVIYLASDASSFVTGSLFFVDGGWTAADGRFAPPL